MTPRAPDHGPSSPAGGGRVDPACRVLVMRHGPAEADSPSGRDFDRALSPGGRRKTEAVARALVARGETVAHIAASPLVRTRQTAEIVASAFVSPPPVTVHDDLAPGENLHAVLQELRQSGITSCLIVAHAPDVTILSATLLGRHAGGFDPATILGIELEGRQSRQLFVLRSADLAP